MGSLRGGEVRRGVAAAVGRRRGVAAARGGREDSRTGLSNLATFHQFRPGTSRCKNWKVAKTFVKYHMHTLQAKIFFHRFNNTVTHKVVTRQWMRAQICISEETERLCPTSTVHSCDHFSGEIKNVLTHEPTYATAMKILAFGLGFQNFQFLSHK